MAFERIHVDREELYQKVWSQPVFQVAKEYGLSDVGLAKICRRLKVPLPGVGYWQQKRAGMKVKKRPLPRLRTNQHESTITLQIEKLPIDEEQYAEAHKMIDFENRPENRICAPFDSENFHPLVKRAEESLRNARCDDHGILRPRRRKCLSIHVSPDSLDRALQIMNTLLKALEARNIKVTIGHTPKCSTLVSVLGEVLEIGLEEFLVRSERQPKTAREKEKMEMWPWPKRPQYIYGPSGRLVLKIKEFASNGIRKAWADGKIQKVENCLNKFILGLIKLALNKRSSKIEAENRRLEWLECQRRQEEACRRREEEEAKVKSLMNEVDAWHKSERIRTYLEAVRNSSKTKGVELLPESALYLWLQWANQYADRIDPLVKTG